MFPAKITVFFFFFVFLINFLYDVKFFLLLFKRDWLLW